MLIASITSSVTDALTSFIGDQGVYAVFVLMFVDAVLPAASELVMVYAGALAAGAFVGQDVVVFGREVPSGWQSFTVMVAGRDDRLHARLARRLGDRRLRRPAARRATRQVVPSVARSGSRAPSAGSTAGEARRSSSAASRRSSARSSPSRPASFGIRSGRYTLLTFVGSTLWCLVFAGIGWAVGENWESFHHAFRYVEYAVAGLLVVGLGYLVLSLAFL